ncbi:MAG TPA: 30S ribosomal protein S4 [Bacteriovoracaceae bacterium]|nr:30S ribosomal protein S4 [Bacteriovoracaceae bacterium]
MAKIDMGRSRFKIQRRLGVELPGLGKAGALERKPYGPGQHGMARKKLSDFTVRLIEKQKVMFNYGLRESQLRNYVTKAKKIKTANWVDTMIIALESRLDNVVFRLNWAPSTPAARQMVSHKHIKVNGKTVNVPGYTVKPGDVIEISDKGARGGNYLQAKKAPRISAIPASLSKEATGEKEKGTMISKPLAEDIPFAFEKRLVIEYYWKVK